MKEFKIRCSSIGKIMGVKGIGKTGESLLKEWKTEQVYGIRKEFTSKYTEKGTIMEDDAIDLVSENIYKTFLLKNEAFFYDDFMCGTPDLLIGDEVVDIKCPWDCHTFPRFEIDLPNKDYYWQLQGYMALTGKKQAKLIYCLVDTPIHLIEKEAYYFANSQGMEYEEVYSDFEKNMTFNRFDIKDRIKVFDIKRNESDIQKIKDRVIDCRNYIKTLI